MNKNEISSNVLQSKEDYGIQKMGIYSSYNWNDDPRRMAFTLSRYKFVAKIFENKENVLEVGCGDGFASRIVAQSVKNLSALDIVEEQINSAKMIMSTKWPINFFHHDMLSSPVNSGGINLFDAAYSLDVLEHIEPDLESIFLTNIVKSLKPNSQLIIGMPSIESQQYASELSKVGHINCKTQPELKLTMEKYFNYVLMFSFNDELLHTGFHKMAHYNIAICLDPK
jgi:2-polyprenyl-3-methyl-5-hydroxy-6-metoxy-1,4-benzoquinol methylase